MVVETKRIVRKALIEISKLKLIKCAIHAFKNQGVGITKFPTLVIP